MGTKERKVNEIYDELRDRATYPFFFYLPKNYFDILIEAKLIDDVDWVFDVLIYARQKMDVLIFEAEEVPKEIFDKQSILRENLFDLKEYESELKTSKFSFLIKKYKEHLFAMYYLSEMIVKHVQEGNEKRYKKYLAYFMAQDNAYMSHKSDIDIEFPSYRNTLEEENYMRACLVDNLNISDILQEEVAIPKQKTKRKKVKYITDLEAQQFLLESVFKVEREK